MRTKNTYTIYTDANGLVIFVTESEFKPTDYAFVLDAEASSQTGFKFDRAKLVLADGTVVKADASCIAAGDYIIYSKVSSMGNAPYAVIYVLDKTIPY